ncbi:hypothetical protein H4R21_005809, partial [Coemansia helicoidea]
QPSLRPILPNRPIEGPPERSDHHALQLQLERERERNKLAARQKRLRKKHRMENLGRRKDELTQSVLTLEAMVRSQKKLNDAMCGLPSGTSSARALTGRGGLAMLEEGLIGGAQAICNQTSMAMGELDVSAQEIAVLNDLLDSK